MLLLGQPLPIGVVVGIVQKEVQGGVQEDPFGGHSQAKPAGQPLHSLLNEALVVLLEVVEGFRGQTGNPHTASATQTHIQLVEFRESPLDGVVDSLRGEWVEELHTDQIVGEYGRE